jgi:hypothetical protein
VIEAEHPAARHGASASFLGQPDQRSPVCFGSEVSVSVGTIQHLHAKDGLVVLDRSVYVGDLKPDAVDMRRIGKPEPRWSNAKLSHGVSLQIQRF